jgi:hypothetical protein
MFLDYIIGVIIGVAIGICGTNWYYMYNYGALIKFVRSRRDEIKIESALSKE